MLPTLRQLEYAVAVADHLHFRRAAEACHVSQPALSSQIQQLEESLGVRLFERGRRGVIVTAAGETVLARARRCLGEVRELVAEVDRARRPFAGPLRLGVIPTLAPYLLPRWIPRIRERYPDYELLLHEERTSHLLEGLRSGELDLLLLALPVDGTDLTQLALFDEPFALLAPDDHPLLRRRRLTTRDLNGEEVLLLEEGHCFRDQALEVCRSAGASGSARVRANSLGTLARMVDHGLGLTLLPESALDAETAPLRRSRWRAFEGASPSRTIGLAWRSASAHEAQYRALGRLLEHEGPGARPCRGARVRDGGGRQ